MLAYEAYEVSCIYSSIHGLGKILSGFFRELLFPIGRKFKQQTDAELFLAAVTSSDKMHSELSWTQHFLWLVLIWHLRKPLSNGCPMIPVM